MTPTFSFENIHAWQKAHLFTVMVYQMTKDFPESEQFGLTSQFRRAAISIEANIAEGYKKSVKLTNSASSISPKAVWQNVGIILFFQEI